MHNSFPDKVLVRTRGHQLHCVLFLSEDSQVGGRQYSLQRLELVKVAGHVRCQNHLDHQHSQLSELVLLEVPEYIIIIL